MLRSATLRVFSSVRGVVRATATRHSSKRSAEEPVVQKLDDGKCIFPPLKGAVGPDPNAAGEVHELLNYEGEGYEGTEYPESAFSDGVSRVVYENFNKVPPIYRPNPTLFRTPAKETDEEFDQRFINYFSRPDIDGWELRKALTHLHRSDLIPEPKVTISAFHAMRRINEHSMAVRWLECIKYKCDGVDKTLYPWMIDQLRPTLDELGISTPEELGFDKPELWLKDVEDM